MSALPPEADIAEQSGNVRFVPKADIPCTARRRPWLIVTKVFACQKHNNNTQSRVRPVGMIVKAEGRSGRAKIHPDDPRHALGLVHYLRTIGYTAWIEDTYGNQIEETALKVAIKLGTLPNDSNRLLGI